MHPPGVFVDRSAAASSTLFNDYRHSYILRYSAEGVARDGWHEITVDAEISVAWRTREGLPVELPRPAVDREIACGFAVGAARRRRAGDPAGVDRNDRRQSHQCRPAKLLATSNPAATRFPVATKRIRPRSSWRNSAARHIRLRKRRLMI